MGISEKLKQLLSENTVPHEVITHPQAFTAQEVAHAIHKTGKVLAKTVVLEINGQHVMAVVPAHHRVNVEAVARVLGGTQAHLTVESKLRELFPDSELGAMPPVGSLYGLPVVLSQELADQKEIIFNAGTHTDCIKMSLTDFDRLARPRVASISEIPPTVR